MKVKVALAGFTPTNQMLETATAAREVGVQGAAIAEHLGFRDAITTAAALAVTTDLELTIVGPAPVSRHPGLLAMQLRCLDELSPGRIRVQVGLGDGFLIAPFGGSHRHGLAQVDELVSALRRLLSGSPVDGNFAGHAHDKCRLYGAPVRVPIDVMAMRPRMLDLACRVADGVSLTTGAGDTYLAETVATAHQRLTELGRDRSDFVVTANAILAVADDHETAIARARSSLSILSPASLAVIGRGAIPDNRLQAALAGELTTDDLLTPEAVARLAIAGTSDEVADRVRAVRETGVNVLAVAVDSVEALAGIDVVVRAAGCDR